MVPTMTGSPTANPYAGLPSNACGGFHLEIVNERATAVRITINGSWSAQLTSGATQVITIAFTQPQPPRFPWDVSIADAASNVELFRATMTGPVDQKVVLSDAGATQGPYSLTAEGC
jgi:hypothetical protein